MALAEEPAALGEQAARRLLKRREAVASFKRSSTYANAVLTGSAMVQQHPNAEDVTLSKRAWERAFRNWRAALRLLAGEE